MAKVTVEFEVDTSKVGKGWFEHRLNNNFPVDEYIKIKKIDCHKEWR